MVESVTSQLLSNIRGAYQRLEDSSNRISRAFTPVGDGDIVGPIQELNSAKRDVLASVKTIKVINDLEGELLDIIA